ncbi:MAG: hypothetical protein ACYDCO_02990 [Armatimonadota bacterium]
MRTLILTLLLLPMLPSAAELPRWVQPAEGAVITGKALVQTTDLGGRGLPEVEYYLEPIAEPDAETFLKQYEKEFSNDNGDPMVAAILLRTVELYFLRVPQAKTTPGVYRLPRERYDLRPPATPVDARTYQINSDFVQPLTVDFSFYLPGRYRLGILIRDYDEKTERFIESKVTREIELRTPGTAPAPTFASVTITPRGTVLAAGSFTDEDEQAEEDALQGPDAMMAGRWMMPLLAVDGKLVGGRFSQDLLPLPADTRWAAEIDLMENLINPFVNPLPPGKHRLSVLIGDRHGNLGIATREIELPLSYLRLATGDPESYFGALPVVTGQPVVLHAQASGGTAPKYCFQRYDGQAWVTVRDWSPEATFRWTPEIAGTFRFQALAREGERTLTAPLTLRANPPFTGVKLTGVPATPITAGSAVTLRARALGGREPYYQFSVFDGKRWWPQEELAATWDRDSFTFFPERAGTYKVKVEASEWQGKTFTDTVTLTTAAPKPLSGVTLKQELDDTGKPDPCLVDREVRLRATRVGGTAGTVRYQFFASADGKQWTALGQPSPFPTCTAGFPRAGKRYFRVAATQAKIRVTADLVLTARAPKPTTGIALVPHLPSPQPVNTAIELNITPNGEDDTYYLTPEVYVWFNDAWLPLMERIYGGGMHFTWHPSEPGTYRLRATVGSREGKTLSQEITYTITP